MSVRSSQPITLQLRELPQLFNSMDPSPFHDRDLDADAEEFILSWARELPAKQPIEMVIRLATPPPGDCEADVERAVRHYFGARVEMKRREFHQLMRRGRWSLLAGLAFLAACLFAAELLTTKTYGPFLSLVRESMLIVGWVAMWRPLEIYLYDWWPLREERRVLERLSQAWVRLEVPPANPPR